MLKWSSQSPDLSSVVFWCCSKTFSIESDWAWAILQRETDRNFQLLQISVTKCDKVQRVGAFMQRTLFTQIYSTCWEVVVQLILSTLKTNLTLWYNWTCSPGYTKTNFKSTPKWGPKEKKQSLSTCCHSLSRLSVSPTLYLILFYWCVCLCVSYSSISSMHGVRWSQEYPVSRWREVVQLGEIWRQTRDAATQAAATWEGRKFRKAWSTRKTKHQTFKSSFKNQKCNSKRFNPFSSWTHPAVKPPRSSECICP